MSVHNVAGMKVFVGGVVSPPFAPLTLADFADQVWIEVANWHSIGDLTEQSSVAQRTNPGPVQQRPGKSRLMNSTSFASTCLLILGRRS